MKKIKLTRIQLRRLLLREVAMINEMPIPTELDPVIAKEEWNTLDDKTKVTILEMIESAKKLPTELYNGMMSYINEFILNDCQG